MKPDIEQQLTSERPTLTEEERAFLWSTIQPELYPRKIPSPYMTWIREHARALAPLLLLFVLLLGGGTTVRADEAGPGDFLFPLDRALERVALAIAPTDEKRMALGRSHAEERLRELRVIVHNSSGTERDESATHASVEKGVDALLRVMDDSEMSDTARTQLYEKLFIEIDPLSVDVRVEPSRSGKKSERTRVEDDTPGGTSIQIDEQSKRTRIWKKDGKVKVEYDAREVKVNGTSREEKGSGLKEKK